MQKLFLELDRMTQKNEKRMHSYFFVLLQALVFFLAWRFDNGTIAMVGVVVFCLMILLFSSDGGLFGGVLMIIGASVLFIYAYVSLRKVV